MTSPQTKSADLYADRTALVNEKLQQQIKRMLALSLGVGVGARGVQGLYNSVRRGAGLGSEPTAPRMLPVPVREEDAPEKPKGLPGYKLANAVMDFLRGGDASSVSTHPLGPASLMLAGGAGLAGGWKLTDYILDKARRAELQSSLDDAKRDYEQALLPPQDKQASALGQELDAFYAELQSIDAGEKQAVSMGDITGGVTGAALAAWLPLALGSGVIAHNITSSRRQQALLNRAMRQRHSRQLVSSPLFAYPSPVHVPPKETPATEPAAGNVTPVEQEKLDENEMAVS